MSNILIIKHGSLGDIAQASGAIQDISENHKNDQIYLLTTKPYSELFKKNPFIHEVIIDKRLPKYNLIYLYFLMKEIKKYKFFKIFDLQNSSRTNFYKNILFPKVKKETWSSSITTLPEVINKKEFDKHSVLDRFNHQLQTSGLKTSYTLNPDFSWACSDVSEIKNFFRLNKFILLFPFCSPHLNIKKWPYYNDLIKLILDKFGDEYKIVTAPGSSEINDTKDINTQTLSDHGGAPDIPQVTPMINAIFFCLAYDTDRADISSHGEAKGLTLIGKHNIALKLSIKRENFKSFDLGD